MIRFGALLTFIGAWGLMIGLAGLQLGVKGPAQEPYSSTPITWGGGILCAVGVVTLVRGLQERRRRIAARDAARFARHDQAEWR